jgi:hypothetical protein
MRTFDRLADNVVGRTDITRFSPPGQGSWWPVSSVESFFLLRHNLIGEPYAGNLHVRFDKGEAKASSAC